MESRIRQIDKIVRNHDIAGRGRNTGVVQCASIVQIVYDGDAKDDFREFFIGSIERKLDGVLLVSPASPFGVALLSHSIGELVEYKAPSRVLPVKTVGLR